MKFRQNSEARIAKRAAPVQVIVIPIDNIFEPRDGDNYPGWCNSTTISTSKGVCVRDKLHGISKPTKMKRGISKNLKPKMNNLNIKTLKSSLGNFFNPSKRIGRQQDIAIEAKYQKNPIPAFDDFNCKLSNFKSNSITTKSVAPVIKPFAPITKASIVTRPAIVDQLPSKPLRMGVRTLSAKPKIDKTDSAIPIARKFPVMGVDAKIIKHNKNKLVAAKQWESDMNKTVDNIIKKDLIPFLDSCDFEEILSVPNVASIPAPVDIVRSPVSTKSKARFATVAPYFRI